MGWGWHRDSRQMAWLPIGLIILGVLLLTGWGRGWFMWIFFFFFILPLIKYVIRSTWGHGYEKHKHDTGDVIILEKPKRVPQYAVGDDGELVEIYDDEDKPKRRQTGADDLEYI